MASCFLTGRHRGTASCCACTGSSHPLQAPKAAPKSVQETLAQGVKAIAPGATVSASEWNWGPYSCHRATARQCQGVGPPPPVRSPRKPHEPLGLWVSAAPHRRIKAQAGLRLPEGLVAVRQEVDSWASLRMRLRVEFVRNEGRASFCEG